jgi:hypothetical protein
VCPLLHDDVCILLGINTGFFLLIKSFFLYFLSMCVYSFHIIQVLELHWMWTDTSFNGRVVQNSKSYKNYNWKTCIILGYESLLLVNMYVPHIDSRINIYLLIIKLFCFENKLIFNEMMMRSALY